MQVPPANCLERGCKHYQGYQFFPETESVKCICPAYPEGIPEDIAYGEEKHLTVRPDQKRTDVFEYQKPFDEEE